MDEQPSSSAAAAPESRAEQIDARRRTVLQQLGELDEELDALRRTRAGISDDDEHDPDGVPFSAQWSRLEGLKRNKLDALMMIDEAEARRASGEDGRCRLCGGRIAPARLKARPEADDLHRLRELRESTVDLEVVAAAPGPGLAAPSPRRGRSVRWCPDAPVARA